MTEQFYKSLVNYFSYAEKLNCTWKEITNMLIRPIESLNNQCEQLGQVNSNKVDNAEICKMTCAREKLIFKINLGIDDEIAIINRGVHSLNDLYQELKNKLNRVQTLKSKVSHDDLLMDNLAKGSSHRPQLSLLLELVMQLHDHYLDSYKSIHHNFITINRNDQQTIETLASSLKTNDQKKIIKILAITQFFINEKTISLHTV